MSAHSYRSNTKQAKKQIRSIRKEEEEEMDPSTKSLVSESEAAPVRRYRIGYAFAPKKEQTFIQPSLLHHASRYGIDFVPISIPDSTTAAKTLIEQGPFDCIIHKIYGPHWNQHLKEYSSQYPQTLILDPPESIERLHNRVSMLDVFAAFELKPRQSGDKFQSKISVPKQVLVDHYPEGEEEAKLLAALEFPVIAKPLLVNGSTKSHEMCLIFSPKGLRSLLADTNSPILLQQFANHGGVVFKGYAIGEHVQCVKRRSLPDISKERVTALEEAVLPFSQISNSANDEHNLAHDPHEMPPLEFVEEAAKRIRVGLKLNFFNFDMIRDSKDPNSYFVIDINYFPGYAKLPNYEHAFTDFLLNLLSTSSHPQKQKELLQLKEEEGATCFESDVK
ncbi:inositol-tetrakisphosphate 1-kinase 1-like [Pyrus x bretschneideri]|uniref:inositol-tetrakisphosphate 1-kinase 1-like n=1 Tax=Pyrus x bretschneideri TaxID=225117 RepID=UPI00202DF84B|nr:inositol-tetrakisphosphate 1-kinase 1-like [Pyrus x bretschneideri]